MKRIFFLICLIVLVSSIKAQRSEYGIFAGTSFYMGDINTSTLFYKPNPAFGIIYRYNFNPHWAFKMDAIYGTVEGYDSDFGNTRNLSFKSHIMEFSAQIELNFLQYFTGSSTHRFSPYIFTGLSVFSFNPQGQYYDPKTGQTNWYDLQPLGTEGQGSVAYPDRKPYSLTQLAIPFGIGFKFSLNKKICIGLEWGMRKTFTDYLDDISTTYVSVWDPNSKIVAPKLADRTIELIDPLTGTNRLAHVAGESRGNSATNDWYSFAGLTVTIKLGYKAKPSCFDKGFNYKDNLYN